MAPRRYLVALAALIATVVVGSLGAVTPASAQGWHYQRHHHRPGYFYSYGPPRRCWTEVRTVRVETRYGWRWRERPIRVCR